MGGGKRKTYPATLVARHISGLNVALSIAIGVVFVDTDLVEGLIAVGMGKIIFAALQDKARVAVLSTDELDVERVGRVERVKVDCIQSQKLSVRRDVAGLRVRRRATLATPPGPGSTQILSTNAVGEWGRNTSEVAADRVCRKAKIDSMVRPKQVEGYAKRVGKHIPMTGQSFRVPQTAMVSSDPLAAKPTMPSMIAPSRSTLPIWKMSRSPI